METRIFGVPLGTVVEKDRARYKDQNLEVPILALNAVRCITRIGFEVEGVFRISGNKEKIVEYYEALNKGESIDFIKEKSSPHDVCSLFKQFLREFPDPVFTYALYNKWIDVHAISDRDTQLKEMKALVDSLPVYNRAMLRLLIPFMYRIAVNSQYNKMDSSNLSKTVGPNLLWREGGGDSIDMLVNSAKINDLVKIMIDEHQYFFPNPIQHDGNTQWMTFDIKLFGHKKSIQNLARGWQDRQLWSCDSNGTIRIWDTQTCEMVKEMESGQGRLFTMTRTTDSEIWTGSGKSAKVWDLQTMECKKEIDGFAYCMARVGDQIWVGGEDKITVYGLDLNLEKVIPVPRNVVMALCADPTGKFVWGGTTDRKHPLQVWNAETGELEKAIEGGHKKKVNAFAVVGDRIWSAADDNTICVWNAQTFSLIKQLEGHQGAVYGLSSFGDFVWSCGWDTTIRIWNSKTLDNVCTLCDYHNDCVSSVLAIKNPKNDQWEAWTSSWDKSISKFTIGPAHFGQVSPQPHLQKSVSSENHSPVLSPPPSPAKQSPENQLPAHLKQKNDELTQRGQMLAQRRAELEEKKRILAARKQSIENKKKDLQARKLALEREVQALSALTPSNPVT